LYRHVTFLHAQKGAKTGVFEPACVMAKKGTLPNAATRRPALPSLGKEAHPLFFLAGATHCALVTENQ